MYKVTEKDVDGFQVLEMTQGEFIGVQWVYGGIKVNENEDDTATLSYDYDIKSDHQLTEEQKEKFGKLTGDILITILEKQLENNEAIYTGGSE